MKKRNFYSTDLAGGPLVLFLDPAKLQDMTFEVESPDLYESDYLVQNARYTVLGRAVKAALRPFKRVKPNLAAADAETGAPEADGQTAPLSSTLFGSPESPVMVTAAMAGPVIEEVGSAGSGREGSEPISDSAGKENQEPEEGCSAMDVTADPTSDPTLDPPSTPPGPRPRSQASDGDEMRTPDTAPGLQPFDMWAHAEPEPVQVPLDILMGLR